MEITILRGKIKEFLIGGSRSQEGTQKHYNVSMITVKTPKLEGIPESTVLGQAIVEKSCRCLSSLPPRPPKFQTLLHLLARCYDYVLSPRTGEIMAFPNYNMKILSNTTMNILCQQSREKALQNTIYSQHHIMLPLKPNKSPMLSSR